MTLKVFNRMDISSSLVSLRSWSARIQPPRSRPQLTLLDGSPNEPDDVQFRAKWNAEHARDSTGQALVLLAFRHHHIMVHTTALRILSCPSDAEDVTQAVFESLAGHVDSIRDAAALPGFLKTCAIRQSLAVLRRKRWWRGRRAAVFLRPAEVDPHRDADAHLVAVVRELLEGLSPQERTVVVLTHVEQHSLSETARLMNLSVSTVRRRLESARTHMLAHADDPVARDLLDHANVEETR